jgi:hypothetical protein
MKMYGKICGSGSWFWFETWFAKIVLDSRDSAALETWDYEDVREDMRLGFGTWFAKVVLDSRDSAALGTWFEKDVRQDIRIDIRADVRTDMRRQICGCMYGHIVQAKCGDRYTTRCTTSCTSVGYAYLEVACNHFFGSARQGCLRHLISLSGAHQVSAWQSVDQSVIFFSYPGWIERNQPFHFGLLCFWEEPFRLFS